MYSAGYKCQHCDRGVLTLVGYLKSAHYHYFAFPALTACYRIEHTWKGVSWLRMQLSFSSGNTSVSLGSTESSHRQSRIGCVLLACMKSVVRILSKDDLVSV